MTLHFDDLSKLHEKVKETINSEWKDKDNKEKEFEVRGYISDIKPNPKSNTTTATVKSLGTDSSLRVRVWCNSDISEKLLQMKTFEVGRKVTVSGVLFLDRFRPEYMIRAKYFDIQEFAAHEAKRRKDKAALEKEGVFLSEKKRRPEDFPTPNMLGLILSLNNEATAEEDIKTCLDNAGFQGGTVIIPTPMEGDKVAEKMTDKIKTLNAMRIGPSSYRPDVIIIARGGPQTRDSLSPFFDPDLARAIANSSIPVVVGIGHAKHKTFACRAADHAAITPTAAAEFIGDLYRKRLGEAEV